jgi:hypothetical protein
MGVIAFASCVGTPATYAAYAVPGLRRVAEPDSVFAELETSTPILEAYNRRSSTSKGSSAAIGCEC